MLRKWPLFSVALVGFFLFSACNASTPTSPPEPGDGKIDIVNVHYFRASLPPQGERHWDRAPSLVIVDNQQGRAREFRMRQETPGDIENWILDVLPSVPVNGTGGSGMSHKLWVVDPARLNESVKSSIKATFVDLDGTRLTNVRPPDVNATTPQHAYFRVAANGDIEQ